MSQRIISTILWHDSKQTSYKIALLRALNDVVLVYPDVGRDARNVAVPLRSLAEAWVAYDWPFVEAGGAGRVRAAVRVAVDGGVSGRASIAVVCASGMRPVATWALRSRRRDQRMSRAAPRPRQPVPPAVTTRTSSPSISRKSAGFAV